MTKHKQWEAERFYRHTCVSVREKETGFQKEQSCRTSSVCDRCAISPLGSFVSDVVHIYYTSDEKVQGDEEIQAFIKDVCSFGMQDFDHCGGCTLYNFSFQISTTIEKTAVNQAVKFLFFTEGSVSLLFNISLV